MMNNQGWIKLHRKLLESTIFSSEKGLKVWIWCLLKANHKDNEVFRGRNKIDIKTGQFITGRDVAKEELKMAVGTIWFWLEQLEVERLIERHATNKYTVVTILNYVKYQKETIELNANSTTDRTQIERKLTTNNNDKNDKKEYIDVLAAFNKTLNTKYKIVPQENLNYWLQNYSVEEIIQAIEKIPQHEYWKDKMSPTLLFRRMNPRKEQVDYIGELLNKGKKKSSLDNYQLLKTV